MKLLVYILIFYSFFAPVSEQESDTSRIDLSDLKLRSVENNAFRAGEKAKYLVHYGPIDAGYASLEIRNAERKLHGREMYHIVGEGHSEGIVDLLFHVEDKYETYLDKEGIFPWLFIRDVSEGGYEIQQTYKFFQDKKKVETQKGNSYQVPFGIQDMFSAAFYVRTLDLRNLNYGDTVSVMSFVDEEIFPLMISFAGREEVKIKSGTYRCLRFHPIIQSGRVFNTAEDLEIWISDDDNKLPILCKANILVGSVKVEIVEYEGVIHPVAKIKD